MARTVTEIRNVLLAQKELHPELNVLNSSSSVSVWRLVLDVVAYAIWTMEKLWDVFKSDVDNTISTLKPHSTKWYAQKAKLFQYGFDLANESDSYNNAGVEDALIAESKIITYAAVVEQTRGLRIKVARDSGSDLDALTDAQLDAFIFYMQQVKDAGVKLNITSSVADSLKLTLTVKYNPLVLNSLGQRIDGTSPTPILSAIQYFLKNLPFNGRFSIQKMVDAIQQVDGVEDLNVDNCQARYGVLPYANINISYLPDSGYLRALSENVTINYIPTDEL